MNSFLLLFLASRPCVLGVTHSWTTYERQVSLWIQRSGSMYGYLVSPILHSNPLSIHTHGHPFKPCDYGTRPHWPRHVREHALKKDLSILDALKLLPLQLLLHLIAQKDKELSPGNMGSGWPAECDLLQCASQWWRRCHDGVAGCGCCCLNGKHSKPQRL